MARGVDVGTARVRAARREDGAVVLADEPTDVALLSGAPEDVPFPLDDAVRVALDGRTAVLGAEAAGLASMAGEDPERLWTADADATALLAPLLESVLGAPEREGEPVGVVVPGAVVDEEGGRTVDADAVRAVLADLGYDPVPVAEGMAVLEAAVPDDATGLAVSVGAATTSVCLAYYGVPVLAFSLPRGGDWVDERAASMSGRPVPEVRDARESGFELGPDTDDRGITGALARAYDELVGAVLDAIGEHAAGAAVEDGVSVPLVVAGGAAAPGLEALFGGRVETAGLPLRVGDVHRAEHPAEAAARGALAAVERDGTAAFADADWDSPWPTAGVTGDDSPAEAVGGDAGTPNPSATEGTPDATTTDARNAADAEDDTARTDRLDDLEADLDALADRAATEAALADLRAEVGDVAEGTADAGDLAEVRGAVADLDDSLADLDETTADAAAVADLREDLSALDAAFAELEAMAAEADRVESLADELADEVDALDADLAALDDRTADAEAVAAVEERVESLDADLSALDAAFAELEAMAAEADRVESLREDVDALAESRADSERVAALADRVADVDETVADLSGVPEGAATSAEVDRLAERLDEVREDIDAIEASVADVAETARTADDRLDRLADRVDAVDDRVATLEAAENGPGRAGTVVAVAVAAVGLSSASVAATAGQALLAGGVAVLTLVAAAAVRQSL